MQFSVIYIALFYNEQCYKATLQKYINSKYTFYIYNFVSNEKARGDG